MSFGNCMRNAFVAVCALTCTALVAQGKVPTFRADHYAVGSSIHAVQADLNGDGALDFIVGVGEILLSNGDGTYRPGGVVQGVDGVVEVIAAGDFDGDANADLVFTAAGAIDFQIAYGNGDGTFRSVARYPGAGLNYINKAVAADFNRDGKLDLAVVATDAVHLTEKRIYTLINTGTTFTPQGPWAVETAYHDPITGLDDTWNSGDFVLGDFDSDGNADVAYGVYADSGPGPIHSRLVALFGNGTQVLGNPVVIKDSDGVFPVASADVNHDAHSDLAGAYWGAPCPVDCTGFDVFYGSSARTFTERKSPDHRTDASPWMYPVVADFNGDHRQDVALIALDSAGLDTFGIVIGTQNPDGSFTTQPYYSLGLYHQQSGTVPARLLLAGDYDRNHKPDLMTIGEEEKRLFLVLNTTSASKYPTCLHSSGQSVHVCSPVAGATFKSPVPFNVGASRFTPLRKVEVWVDGKKRKELFFSYSNYSYMDTKISLVPGSHKVDVFAVGYDSNWIKNSFTFQVSP